jgi:hypothetical protein
MINFPCDLSMFLRLLQSIRKPADIPGNAVFPPAQQNSMATLRDRVQQFRASKLIGLLSQVDLKNPMP